MQNSYLDFDNCSQNGAFTESTKKDINMLALMEYCRVKKIPYEQLTEHEINRFLIRDKKTS